MLAIVRKQIVAAVEPIHQRGDQAGVASHEAPHVVPEASIPLKPLRAGKTSAELVYAGGIPWLRDETQLRQVRVRHHVRDE